VASTDVWVDGADLAGFVRREEEGLFHAAVLVRADLPRAEELVEDALVAVGRRWSQAADEDPRAEVWGRLYRAAVGDAAQAGTGPGARARAAAALGGTTRDQDWVQGPRRVEHERHRDEVAHALARLTARQRAVLTLLALDGASVPEAARTLRVLPRSVRHDARDAVAVLATDLPDENLDDGRADGPAVRRLLDTAVADLPPPDLVERVALSAIESRRTLRRRSLLVAGGAVGAGAFGAVLVRHLGAEGSPEPRPTGDPVLATTVLGGVRVHPAPGPEEEAALPTHPDRGALPVPDPVGPGDPSLVRPLPSGVVAAAVEAVYLVRAGEAGAFVPVLRMSGPGRVQWLVPGVELPSRSEYELVGPGTVAPDRRRLALPAAARVVVLDVPSGRTTEVDVPDPTLRTAGWTADGRTVLVRARAGGWAVDPEARTVERVGDARAPGWGELAWVGGATVVRRLADDGRVSDVEAVGGPPVLPFGPSASTPQGWVAAAAFLPGRYQDELGLSQGVVAVGPGGPLRALAYRAPVGSSALRFRVLGWVEPATALIESRSLVDQGGGLVLRVLAWDVVGERLWQVGTVDGVGGPGSWFRGQWGL
jgi:DNA-directed RNA polymerase specialized sigma24 family protein